MPFLSDKLLADLRVARDRLNQNASNSSSPSGSQAPWEASGSSGTKQDVSEPGDVAENEGSEEKPAPAMAAPKPSGSQRKPGKQPGSKGAGRRLEMRVTDVVEHKAAECSGCGARFAEESPFVATTGKYVLDIEKRGQGLEVTHVKHLYGERVCRCGHVTQTMPQRCGAEEGWEMALTEWHVVGPLLSALIICLSMRMRLSRQRIQEFLADWLGITLSTGCLNPCITEGGRAAAPLEDAIIDTCRQRGVSP